jgi:hypothetical protein
MNEIGVSAAEDPRLSPDFAVRVLRHVEAIGRRRRRTRIAAMAAGAAILIVGAGLGLSTVMVPEMTGPAPQARTDTELELAALDVQGERTDALNYLFPDAASVAAFQGQFAGEDEGDGVENAVAMPAATSDDDLAL